MMSQTVKELHNQRKKLWNASIASHKKYIDPENGLFKPQFLESRNCPVCGTNDYIVLFAKEGGQYVKCLSCSMVYINPVFTDEALNDYYGKNHSVQAELVEDGDPFYEKLYNSGLDSIERYSPKGSILDIGCSSGIFLNIAREREWTTYGVELNVGEYSIASKRGHIVYNELLDKITFEAQFNAVTLWDVFEHIKDGGFYLNMMKKLLFKKGIIFLQIPSSDALAARILQEKCNMFDGLEHVNLYGVSTIRRLADKCGLKILDIRTVIPEIGVINNYLNYEDPYQGSIDNKTDIPNLINENELNERLMGYKLQVVLGGMK
ncbi:MAG: class I SAM-dependent methyltransferase [Desulfobacula sp.]|nr:class I SAM-dependent methyltransferase [Desulfobacula sp.]